MNILLTAALTACALVVVLFTYRRCEQCANEALESALRAERCEVRLKVARGDVIALQAHVGALEAQLQRLQGRVYAQPRRDRGDIAAALQASDDPRARAVGEAHALLGVGLAVETQRACSCGWCETCLHGPVGKPNGVHA